MENPFNKLYPSELERLAMLAEELGETQVAIGKIMRHGYESRDPTDSKHPGNRAALAGEIGDVLGEIYRLLKHGDVDDRIVDARRRMRVDASEPYTHHQSPGSSIPKKACSLCERTTPCDHDRCGFGES